MYDVSKSKKKIVRHPPMPQTCHAVALFSGGLDSILAVKIIEEQGLTIKCLHFVSPFFGKPERCEHWQRVYGLDIVPVDVGDAFIALLRKGAVYGFGKVMNPCVDCKILMLRTAAELMRQYGAQCVISGEVIGQRPMSQRRDTLDIIRRESGLGDRLLRPLSAAHQIPTAVEREGLVDRSRLHAIYGRGRTAQLALAQRFGLTEIPTPAGGCRLTEKESAHRYQLLLTHKPDANAADFALANIGRQLWTHSTDGIYWLCIGRNAADNALLEASAHEGDIYFTLRDMPGPLGLARPIAVPAVSCISWPADVLKSAAAAVASYSTHAVRQGGPVCVEIRQGGICTTVHVTPQRTQSYSATIHNGASKRNPDFSSSF